jgi:hypothetical protein
VVLERIAKDPGLGCAVGPRRWGVAVILERIGKGLGPGCQFEPFGCGGLEGFDELPFEAGSCFDVQQEKRTRFHGIQREGAARGVVGEFLVGESLFVCVEEQGEVGARAPCGLQLLGSDAVEPQVFQRAGEGSGEAGEIGDGSQVGEAGPGAGCDAGSDGFTCDAAHGHEAALQHRPFAHGEHQIPEGMAVNAEACWSGGSAREVGCGFAGAGEDQDRGAAVEELGRSPEEDFVGVRGELQTRILRQRFNELGQQGARVLVETLRTFGVARLDRFDAVQRGLRFRAHGGDHVEREDRCTCAAGLG